MIKRILTATVALAVFAAVLLLPPIVFTVCLAAVTLMMLYECYTATKADWAMKITGGVSALALMYAGYVDNAVTAVIAAVVLAHTALVITEHGKRKYTGVLANGFLTLYIVLSMGCVWITKQEAGTPLMLLIFVAAWSTDTFAYFSGKLFGKHKLIPHVSPNKTVEGSVGGVIGSMICCTAYLFILNATGMVQYTMSRIIVIGIAAGLSGGVFSQLGDLAASAIKRDVDIKDFGWIFPGHGGFMDRFDSVLFIAPIIYALLYFTPTIF